MAARSPTPRRKPKNKKTKTQVVFDEEKRKDYLSGFKKRKDERRRKGREELEQRLKEERKQIMLESKKVLLQIYEQETLAPEVETIVKPITYDLEDHTVTITAINDVDFQGKHDLLLGQNTGNQSGSEGEEEVVRSVSSSIKLNAEQRKAASKKITSSKAFKLKEKLKQKSDLKKQRRKKKKILSKRQKHNRKQRPRD